MIGAAFFEMVFFSSARFGRCVSFLSSPIVALFLERFQIIINFPETPQKRHGFLPCPLLEAAAYRAPKTVGQLFFSQLFQNQGDLIQFFRGITLGHGARTQ